MHDFLARRPLMVNGRKIPPGERVPMEDLSPSRQRQLVEHGHVVMHSEYAKTGAESGGRRKER